LDASEALESVSEALESVSEALPITPVALPITPDCAPRASAPISAALARLAGACRRASPSTIRKSGRPTIARAISFHASIDVVLGAHRQRRPVEHFMRLLVEPTLEERARHAKATFMSRAEIADRAARDPIGAGSVREVMATLEVAVALGHLEPVDASVTDTMGREDGTPSRQARG